MAPAQDYLHFYLTSSSMGNSESNQLEDARGINVKHVFHLQATPRTDRVSSKSTKPVEHIVQVAVNRGWRCDVMAAGTEVVISQLFLQRE